MKSVMISGFHTDYFAILSLVKRLSCWSDLKYDMLNGSGSIMVINTVTSHATDLKKWQFFCAKMFYISKTSVAILNLCTNL